MNEKRNIKTRIESFCRDKVNAFSPTISPAPKSWERNEIESPSEGLKYYFEKGITEFVIQKKYMGSYCDIYLTKDLNETYFVSRNGYKISHIDIDMARYACKNLHQRFDWSELKLIIIQSEMMPWSILGKGLINNEFKAYHQAHKSHFEYLMQSDLYQKIELIKASDSFHMYTQDKEKLDERTLKKTFPSHVIRQYDAIDVF
jgi:hypothetical protein